MKFRQRTLDQIADMICGNFDQNTLFIYRSSSYLTQFFRDCDTDYEHDGSTRKIWVSKVLEKILEEPHLNAATPPDTFIRVIKILMDPSDATNEGAGALSLLNTVLAREGFEAFYAEDNQCYLKHIATNTIPNYSINPHRPFYRRN